MYKKLLLLVNDNSIYNEDISVTHTRNSAGTLVMMGSMKSDINQDH